jgi:hypothetical protein
MKSETIGGPACFQDTKMRHRRMPNNIKYYSAEIMLPGYSPKSHAIKGEHDQAEVLQGGRHVEETRSTLTNTNTTMCALFLLTVMKRWCNNIMFVAGTIMISVETMIGAMKGVYSMQMQCMVDMINIAQISITEWLNTERTRIKKIIQEVSWNEISGNRKLAWTLKSTEGSLNYLPICVNGWDQRKKPSPDKHIIKNEATEESKRLMLWTRKNVIVHDKDNPKNNQFCMGFDSGNENRQTQATSLQTRRMGFQLHRCSSNPGVCWNMNNDESPGVPTDRHCQYSIDKQDRQYYVVIKVLIGKSHLSGPEPRKAKSWLRHLFSPSPHSFYEIQFN